MKRTTYSGGREGTGQFYGRAAPQIGTGANRSMKKHRAETSVESEPPFPGGGMGITRGAGVGTKEMPDNPPAQGRAGRRVVGGIFPGEGMGLAPRGYDKPSLRPGGMAKPGLNQPGSAAIKANVPTPVSIQNTGRSYYGPLSYSSENVENRPYATGGMAKGNRKRSKASPDKANPRQKGLVFERISRFTKED
jgi:hypothetical protein